MPISPIVLQRRHAELGRIRLGAKRNGNGAPMKLDSFRFTSVSAEYIRDLAELYGGTPQQWDNNGIPSWEVYTTATSIPVIAVKGGLSQWMETWSGGGCVHRCDGERGADGELCNPDDRAHQDARPTTRLSTMLPELDAIGVWRMESHGWNAAAEIPAVAELAQYVGDLVPAVLHLVERRAIKDGKTSRFVVPVLDLRIGQARLREIVQSVAGGTAELEAPASAGVAAIEAPAASSGPNMPTDADLDARDEPGLRKIWDWADNAGFLDTDNLRERITSRVQRLRSAETPAAPPAAAPAAATAAAPDEDGVVEAELVPTPGTDPATPPATGGEDAIWAQILKLCSERRGWSLDQVSADFVSSMGMAASVATAGELSAYLQMVESGEQVPA